MSERKKEFKIIETLYWNTKYSGGDGGDWWHDEQIRNGYEYEARQFGKFLYDKIPYEDLPIIELCINSTNSKRIIIDKKLAIKVKKFWFENRKLFPYYYDEKFMRNYINPIDLSD